MMMPASNMSFADWKFMTSVRSLVLMLLSCAAVRGNYLSQYYYSDSSCSGNAIGWLGVPMASSGGCFSLGPGGSMYRTCGGSLGYTFVCSDNACRSGCRQQGAGQNLNMCVPTGLMWQTWTCSDSPTVPSHLAPAVAFYPIAGCSGNPGLYLASTGACEASSNGYLYYARTSSGYVVKSGCNFDGTCGSCSSEFMLNGDNQCQASPSGAGLAFPYYKLDLPAPSSDSSADVDVVSIVIGVVAVVVVAVIVTVVIILFVRRRRAQAAASYEQMSNLTLDDGATASTFEQSTSAVLAESPLFDPKTFAPQPQPPPTFPPPTHPQQLTPPAFPQAAPPTAPPTFSHGWQFERCSNQQPCSKAGCKFFMKRHPQDGGIHCNIAGCANFMTWHVGPCQSKFGRFGPAGGWDGQTYSF